jgi:hypothetical protein
MVLSSLLSISNSNLQPTSHIGREAPLRMPRRRGVCYEVIDFLAALDQAPIEALYTLFLEDLLARPLEKSDIFSASLPVDRFDFRT